MKTEKKLLLSVLLAVCTTTLSAQAAAADTAPAAQPEKKEAAELKTAEAGDAVQQTEEKNHNLGETVVTAQRVRKSELNTPAETTVLTAKDIKKAGYRNAGEAIEQQLGALGTAFGGSGSDFGVTNSSRLSLRGFDGGTLVLVDGVPMNIKDSASLDNIPVSMIERIEIVKGAASTLYGGEAMGGVVNIILKKPSADKTGGTLSVTMGNYLQKTEASYADSGFIFDISREWSKNVAHSSAFGADKLSWTDYWTGKGQKNRFGMTARLSDEVFFHYNYTESTITHGGWKYRTRALTNPTRIDYRYNDYRQTGAFLYQGKTNGIRAVLGYNYRKSDAWDLMKNTRLSTANTIFDTEVFDVQKTWRLGGDTLVAGYTYKREAADNTVKSATTMRASNGIYTAYTRQVSPKFSTTFGLRGEFIHENHASQNVCLPQLQLEYKLDRNTAWYANMGRAFQMPNVDDAINYSNSDGSALRPERGWTYETGLKLKRGQDSWQFALYHMDMTNKLGWAKDTAANTYYPVNKGDFRNTGLEIEYNRHINDCWNLRLGGSISNPQIKDPTAVHKDWVQDSARLQGVIGLDYKKAKWTGSMNFKYLGDREYYAPSNGYAQDVPSNVQLSLNTTYACDAANEITLGIYNLLGRDLYLSKYGNLDLPRNYRLTFVHKF